MQNGRPKAYRPLPPDIRREALEEGLAAYSRGDYFEAHELMEPAWMGTSDLAERALYQGLIKLAAAYVHAVRGNPIGLVRNLRGARQYLATSLEVGPGYALGAGINLPLLIADVDERIGYAASIAENLVRAPVILIDLVPAAPIVR